MNSPFTWILVAAGLVFAWLTISAICNEFRAVKQRKADKQRELDALPKAAAKVLRMSRDTEFRWKYRESMWLLLFETAFGLGFGILALIYFSELTDRPFRYKRVELPPVATKILFIIVIPMLFATGIRGATTLFDQIRKSWWVVLDENGLQIPHGRFFMKTIRIPFGNIDRLSAKRKTEGSDSMGARNHLFVHSKGGQHFLLKANHLQSEADLWEIRALVEDRIARHQQAGTAPEQPRTTPKPKGNNRTLLTFQLPPDDGQNILASVLDRLHSSGLAGSASSGDEPSVTRLDDVEHAVTLSPVPYSKFGRFHEWTLTKRSDGSQIAMECDFSSSDVSADGCRAIEEVAESIWNRLPIERITTILPGARKEKGDDVEGCSHFAFTSELPKAAQPPMFQVSALNRGYLIRRKRSLPKLSEILPTIWDKTYIPVRYLWRGVTPWEEWKWLADELAEYVSTGSQPAIYACGAAAMDQEAESECRGFFFAILEEHEPSLFCPLARVALKHSAAYPSEHFEPLEPWMNYAMERDELLTQYPDPAEEELSKILPMECSEFSAVASLALKKSEKLTTVVLLAIAIHSSHPHRKEAAEILNPLLSEELGMLLRG